MLSTRLKWLKYGLSQCLSPCLVGPVGKARGILRLAEQSAQRLAEQRAQEAANRPVVRWFWVRGPLGLKKCETIRER